jgi:DNA-directed RNA polymerase subunit F
MFLEELRKYEQMDLPIVAMYQDLGKTAFLLLLREETAYNLARVAQLIPQDQQDIRAIFEKVRTPRLV